ncbi:MAG: DUF4097 domain-containing protein [Candidatus Bathyarchaeia archaeon]
MRTSTGLGLGGLLLGLGLGWYIFSAIEVSYQVFAWILIITGAGIVVSALFARALSMPLGVTVGAVSVGLILSLLLTSGIGFIGPYRAEGTRTFEGDVAADIVYFEVENRNGAIRVSTWDKSEYNVELTIRARGITESEAEKTIEGLDIDLVEQVSQGQLRLILNYGIPSQTWRRLSIEVTVVLPADAEINLDLESSNGGIYLSEIVGDTVGIQTSNGALDLDKVYANSIVGSTSNGRIDGEIEAKNTSLTTSNGKIELTLPCNVSGEYDLSTSNGDIELTVSPSQQVGYDLDLSTSNGNINLNLSDLEYSLNEKTSKEARTMDFASRAVQITIEADTSNGNIDLGTP